MAKRVLCRLGQWCSRVFAVECEPNSDPVYFSLSKNPQPRLSGEQQTFERIFGGAKSYSLHVCTDDRFQRVMRYEDLKNNLISALPRGSLLDVFSFLPDVKNSLFRGFLIKDAEAIPMFHELVMSSWVNVCTYVQEEDGQWWQHLWFKSEDTTEVLVDKYCLVPHRMPQYHPSTLNIIGNDVFYSFGDAHTVIEQCVDIIPEAKELLELVDQNLTLKRDGQFPVIVIEGLDATGKTTLTRSLTVKLSATLLRSPPQCLSPWRQRFDSEPALLRRAFYAVGNYITATQIAVASQHSPVLVDSLKLSDVLDLLDVRYTPSAVRSITVIHTLEIEAIDSDCDSDGSDREYQGKTGHLPGRLLNGDAEVNYLEDEADVHENQLVCPPHPHPHPPPTPAEVSVEANSTHCHILASLRQQPARKGDALSKTRPQDATKKQKTSLQNMKNRNRVFKRSKQ